MIIERDLPVEMDDGVVLRVDVYRPDTKAKAPIVMAGGPYGKGVKYQEHYKPLWDSLVKMHPDILEGSQHRWLTWETVDPEIWVPWGYACVRFDSRGAGRSPGYLDIFSPRETKDFAIAIEWAGKQKWSNGKVGLNGVSYYAINQWQVAALTAQTSDGHDPLGGRRRPLPRLGAPRGHSLEQVHGNLVSAPGRGGAARQPQRPTRPLDGDALHRPGDAFEGRIKGQPRRYALELPGARDGRRLVPLPLARLVEGESPLPERRKLGGLRPAPAR